MTKNMLEIFHIQEELFTFPMMRSVSRVVSRYKVTSGQ